MLWKLKFVPQIFVRCKQVVVFLRWSLTQVWLYFLGKSLPMNVTVSCVALEIYVELEKFMNEFGPRSNLLNFGVYLRSQIFGNVRKYCLFDKNRRWSISRNRNDCVTVTRFPLTLMLTFTSVLTIALKLRVQIPVSLEECYGV